MAKVNVKNKKRVVFIFVIFMAVLLLLAFRVAWIQIVDANEYTEKAVGQQTSDIPIEAKRGSILDSNGLELAVTANCYSIWVRPAQLNNDNTSDKIANYAKQVAKILSKDESEVLKDFKSDSTLIKIGKYLDKATADKIRALNISGLEISEDTKRYYPLGNFASKLLGSVTDQNEGRTGIELQYDQYLSGLSGRWVKNTDLNGNTLSYGTEKYYQAEDGLNVVMTIDEVIQHYAEKALASAMKSTKSDRMMCLVMNPKTGDVLAMVTTPSYDPNDATEPDSKSELKKFNKLTEKEQVDYLSEMWRNPIVSDTYEPGSTFKLITDSAALEEGLTKPTEKFNCTGSINVNGTILHCWDLSGHGIETLTQAVGNSCNPVHVQLALRLGIDKFYNYLDLFGVIEKTGIDYPGETSAIVQSKDTVGQVGLATMGFGQGIAVTPIELLTAVCAIGNNGILIQPRLVKELTDSDGNVVKTFSSNVVRKVISSETASEMCDIMEYVVSNGGAGAAKISGYKIGGKTGTANKAINGKYSSDTYSSFIGMAPIDDPKIVILVIADNPKGIKFGSVTAAPAAKVIMENTLRYLEIEPEYSASEKAEQNSNYVTVPNITESSYSDAIGILAGKGLEYEISPKTNSTSDFTVAGQYPKAGSKIKKNGIVYIYKN